MTQRPRRLRLVLVGECPEISKQLQGELAYHCTFHPHMKGVIIVVA
jgi:plastocyanin